MTALLWLASRLPRSVRLCIRSWLLYLFTAPVKLAKDRSQGAPAGRPVRVASLRTSQDRRVNWLPGARGPKRPISWPPRPRAAPPPSRENENLAKYSHKTPTRDELVVARVIGLANPGSFR